MEKLANGGKHRRRCAKCLCYMHIYTPSAYCERCQPFEETHPGLPAEIEYGPKMVSVMQTFAHDCRWMKPNRSTLMRVQKPTLRWTCRCGMNAD